MTSVALTSPLTSLASRLAIHRNDPLWAGDGHKGSEDPQAGEDWEILTQWPMRLEDKKQTLFMASLSYSEKKKTSLVKWDRNSSSTYGYDQTHQPTICQGLPNIH